MNRSDFYSDRRKERKINFLADYPIVRKYLCRKHGLKAQDFQLLCKLHSLGTFLRSDFEEHKLFWSWDLNRWTRMLKEDWIVVYRERKPSEGRNYKIYSISYKCKKMVEDCYRMLCGEMAIPESTRHNKVMKEETYSDKRLAAAIRAFNAARNEK